MSDPSDLRIACAPSVFRVPAGVASAASPPSLATAQISCGHGSPDSWEEASFLICRGLKLPFDHFDMFLDAALTHNELSRLVHLIDRRVHEKVPTAYLLREAWLTEHRFYIDERALIPRSYIAELLEEDF